MSVTALGETTRLIELSGELTGRVAERVIAQADPYLARGSIIVLDIGIVEYVDAAGFHALIVLARLARARGARMGLTHPSPASRWLIRRIGADRVIDVHDDAVADALER
ncbi:STAS domain-containing protein [Actinospica durhamensis]|uniref:STAS domain-containing protein n=1 Tax=Actinospica durhamensis TaxID=1508375 RepID=A0A941EI26_9ACTN|nr:STAS domain-containing protein [Actinospica durhamensis]MBR7832970.1 STAS domain-containing protein [Actinospica durhamensis]